MRIGDAVEDEQERRPAPAGAAQRLELDLFEGPGMGQNTLRRIGARGALKLGAGDEHEAYAPTRGQSFDLVDLRRGVEVLGDPDLAHWATARGEQLAHGVAALDLFPPQAVPSAAATTGAPRSSPTACPPATGTARGVTTSGGTALSRRGPSSRGAVSGGATACRRAPRPAGPLRGDGAPRPGEAGRRRRGGPVTAPR